MDSKECCEGLRVACSASGLGMGEGLERTKTSVGGDVLGRWHVIKSGTRGCGFEGV